MVNNNAKRITKKKKFENLKKLVFVCALCIIILVTATYAWFTLSNTARVTNMQLTVGDVTGLQIAPDDNGQAGPFSATYDLNNEIFKGNYSQI